MALFSRWRLKHDATLVLTERVNELLERGATAGPDGAVGFFQMYSASYGRIYKTQSALRAVVDFLATNIGQCKMRVIRDVDGVRLPVPDHPLQRLLDHPQAGVPGSKFRRRIIADQAIYDTAAVWKIRERFDPTPRSDGTILNEGVPVRLVRVPVPFVQISAGSLTAAFEFTVQTGSKSIRVPAADMMWLPGYSPDSNIQGVPPIETLRQILAEEWAAGKDRENYWRNGVQGNVVFLQDAAAGGLAPDAADRFKTGWRNKYGGVASSNAREWPLIPPGITPKELTIDAQSAEYLSTRTLAREECCRAYGMQAQLLGITPSNYGSMDMYHQMLYQDTLAPRVVPFQEDFEEQLLHEFEPEGSGYFIDVNLNAKLQGSFLDQAKIGQQAVGGPWMTRNEFREKFQGLPPVEGGDEIIVPLNVVLAGGPQANPQDAPNQFAAEVVDLTDVRSRQRLAAVLEQMGDKP